MVSLINQPNREITQAKQPSLNLNHFIFLSLIKKQISVHKVKVANYHIVIHYF